MDDHTTTMTTIRFLVARVTSATFLWGAVTGMLLVFILTNAMIWTLR